MNREKERSSTPAAGGTSLLVVFAVLCLTVFALLSLATVQADERLAAAGARAVQDYYAADCRAQEILARLRNGEFPEGVFLDGERTVYEVPVTEGLRLEVELDRRLEVLRWQLAPAGGWEADETLDLWEGDGIFLGIEGQSG